MAIRVDSYDAARTPSDRVVEQQREQQASHVDGLIQDDESGFNFSSCLAIGNASGAVGGPTIKGGRKRVGGGSSGQAKSKAKATPNITVEALKQKTRTTRIWAAIRANVTNKQAALDNFFKNEASRLLAEN